MPTGSDRCGGVSSASGLGRSSPQRSSLSSRPGSRSLLLTAPRRRCGSRCPRCSSCSSRAGRTGCSPGTTFPSRFRERSLASTSAFGSSIRYCSWPALVGVIVMWPSRSLSAFVVVVVWLFAVAEYINYFHIRLSYPWQTWASQIGPMVDTEAGPRSAAGCLSLRPAGPVRTAAPRWPRPCAAAWRRSSSSTGRRPRHRRAAPTSQLPPPRPRAGRRRPRRGL
jgi:hypothetical protein